MLVFGPEYSSLELLALRQDPFIDELHALIRLRGPGDRLRGYRPVMMIDVVQVCKTF